MTAASAGDAHDGTAPVPSPTRPRPARRPRRVLILAGVLVLAAVLVLAGVLVERDLASPAAVACPVRTPPLQGEPNESTAVGWQGIANATCVPWTAGSVPVVSWFALPMTVGGPSGAEVVASTWTLEQALSAFGILLSVVYTTSGPQGAYPNTPGLNLSGTSSTSPFISWQTDVGEANPSPGSPGSTYVDQYASGYAGAFLVVGGLYFAFDLLPPSVLECQTASQVAENLTQGEGPVYAAVNSTASYLEAYLWKADSLVGVSPPAPIEANPTVAAIERSIR